MVVNSNYKNNAPIVENQGIDETYTSLKRVS